VAPPLQAILFEIRAGRVEASKARLGAIARFLLIDYGAEVNASVP
jgi:hypothetical protein